MLEIRKIMKIKSFFNKRFLLGITFLSMAFLPFIVFAFEDDTVNFLFEKIKSFNQQNSYVSNPLKLNSGTIHSSNHNIQKFSIDNVLEFLSFSAKKFNKFSQAYASEVNALVFSQSEIFNSSFKNINNLATIYFDKSKEIILKKYFSSKIFKHNFALTFPEAFNIGIEKTNNFLSKFLPPVPNVIDTENEIKISDTSKTVEQKSGKKQEQKNTIEKSFIFSESESLFGRLADLESKIELLPIFASNDSFFSDSLKSLEAIVQKVEKSLSVTSATPGSSIVYLTSQAPVPSTTSGATYQASGVSAGFGEFSQGLGTGGDFTARGNVKLGSESKEVSITSKIWNLTAEGALSGITSFSSSATTTVGAPLTVSGSATSSISNLTLSGLRVTNGVRFSNPLTFSDLNCSTLSNGGTLTTDAQGTVLCAADDSGGGGASAVGADGQIQFVTSGSLNASANVFFNNTYGFLGLGGTTTASTIAADIPQLSIEIGTSTYPLWIGDQGTTSPIFVVQGNGRVGIGTTSPGSLFSVQGLSTDVISTALISNLGSNLSFVVEDQANETTPFAIDSAGNVGIKTATPDGSLHILTGSAGSVTADSSADDLVVENSAGAGISILAPDASNSRLLFGSPTDNLGGFLQWNYDSSLFRIGTSKTGGIVTIESGDAVEAIRILADLNVGIGTPSPKGRLQVQGPVITSGDFFISGNDINLGTGSASTTISGGDGIGIGTTTPGRLLSVAGNAYFDSTLISFGSSTQRLGTELQFMNVATTTIATSTVNAWSIATSLTGIPIFTIDTSVNRARIGFGTTSPGTTFSVAGAGTDGAHFDLTSINFASSSAPSLTLNYFAPATSTIPNNQKYAFSIATSTSNTKPIFSISTDGNSWATTTVHQSFSIDNDAFLYNAITGSTTIDTLSLSSLNFDTNAGVLSLADLPVDNNASNNTIESYSAQIDGNSVLTIFSQADGGGNVKNLSVGIGTTTPGRLLSVAGSAYFDSTLISFGSSTQRLGTEFQFMNVATTTLATSTVNAFSFATTTSGIPVFTIDTTQAAGRTERIGIGTTTPAEELSIHGDIILQLNGVASTNGLCHTGDNVDAASAVGRAIVACSSGPADIAEWYETEIGVEEGDVVMVTDNTITYEAPGVNALSGNLEGTIKNNISILAKATEEKTIIGVVSSDPAQTIGRAIVASSTNPHPIAFSGRVPVKVNDEGGSIKIGDRISISSIPGIGKKAENGESTVGIALESFNNSEGMIMIFINLGQNTLSNSISGGAIQTNWWNVDELTGRIISTFALDMNSKEIINVRNILSSSGNWSIGDDGRLFVKEIETEKIKIKNPYGITIFDADTGEPVCVVSKSGVLTTIPGECNSNSQLPVSKTDTEAPILEILGNNPADILIGSSYSDNGANVTDNIDSNLGYQTFLDGVLVSEIQLDTSTTTTYNIEYKSTDSAGNTGSAIRIVNIVE